MDKEVSRDERDIIIYSCGDKVFRSGYSKGEKREIIPAGLTTYGRKLGKCEEEGSNIHRDGSKGVMQRIKKKVMENKYMLWHIMRTNLYIFC